MTAQKFDESKHPRGADGTFASKAYADAGQLDLGDGNPFAPLVFDPAAHHARFVDAFDLRDDETPFADYGKTLSKAARDRGGLSCCTCCGQGLRYANLFDSDLGRFVVGDDCADNIGVASMLGVKSAQLRAQAAIQRENLKRAALRDAAMESDPELAEAFALRERSGFLSDVYDKFSARTTPHQIESVKRVAAQIRRRDADAQAWENMEHTPVPEGKQTVEGRVVSRKTENSFFNGRSTTTTKMLVIDNRGFKVWVTQPSSLYYRDSTPGASVESFDVTGSVVRFDAALTRSDRDEFFGFGKRPTKASIVKPAKILVGGRALDAEGAARRIAELEEHAATTENSDSAQRCLARAEELRARLAELG